MVASRYIDETFDINNCHNYILSIQCALDGFSFSVYDTTVNKFVVLVGNTFVMATPFRLKNELDKLIEAEPILNQNYKRVNCAFITSKLTIVPKALISKEEYPSLFSLAFEQTRDEEIISDGSPADYKLLSAIPGIIKRWFFEHYSNCVFFTPLSAILNYSKQRATAHQQVYILKQGLTLFVVVQTNHSIDFANTFFVKDDNDCLYYILNVARQMQLTTKTELCLVGTIPEKSLLEISLKDYFTKVNRARYSSRYAVSYTFLKEPENYYIPLIELALCE